MIHAMSLLFNKKFDDLTKTQNRQSESLRTTLISTIESLHPFIESLKTSLNHSTINYTNIKTTLSSFQQSIIRLEAELYQKLQQNSYSNKILCENASDTRRRLLKNLISLS